jgi:hypothetical protein
MVVRQCALICRIASALFGSCRNYCELLEADAGVERQCAEDRDQIQIEAGAANRALLLALLISERSADR